MEDKNVEDKNRIKHKRIRLLKQTNPFMLKHNKQN